MVVESRFISVSAIATLFVKTGNGCEGGKSHHYRSRSLPQDELTTGVKHQRQRLTSIQTPAAVRALIFGVPGTKTGESATKTERQSRREVTWCRPWQACTAMHGG